MRKVYNFNAGPAMLPEEVLLKAQSELLDWNSTGMSIMEIGHRTEEFKTIRERTEQDLRDLMQIPNHYKVLFLAGGASTQFAMVPLNLFVHQDKADYVDTGVWSKKAIAEAKRYGTVNIPAAAKHYDDVALIPSQNEWKLSSDAAYLHYTPNETIDGLQFHWVPKVDVPLVADMTSMILSEPVKVNDFGIIYAGAQKNIGFAGLNIVILNENLLADPLPHTPTLYSYKLHAENNSLYNTPPTYNWYMAGLIFAWMKEMGGVETFYKINLRKAEKIYHCIDEYSDFYQARVDRSCRSIMNVMFYLKDEGLTPIFLEEAAKIGLVNLQGHRVSGGVRASIYNAMPEDAIDKLVKFMHTFVKLHGASARK